MYFTIEVIPLVEKRKMMQVQPTTYKTLKHQKNNVTQLTYQSLC